MKIFLTTLSKVFAFIWIPYANCQIDTLDLGPFLYKMDTSTVFNDSGGGAFGLVDTNLNMAITLTAYKGFYDLDSLVDKNFAANADFEYVRDSIRFDSLGIKYYYKYAKAKLDDSTHYVVFGLAKQWDGITVMFHNALIPEYAGAKEYLAKIHNVVFKGYEEPEPVRLKKRYLKVYNMRVLFKGRDLRGRK